MLHIQDFTQAQHRVIRVICKHQLNSLQRLYDGTDHSQEDVKMLLIQAEISEDEHKATIDENIKKFQRLEFNPDDLTELSDDDLSTFRHLLFHIEDDWKEKYPKAISNLWNRLFLIEEIRNNDGKENNVINYN